MLTPNANAQPLSRGFLSEIGIDQRLGQQVGLDLHFRDEQGKSIPLGGYFRGRPVVLALVYYQCPMLCTEVLNGLLESLRALPWDAGDQFDVLVVSFDHRERPALAAEKRRAYLTRYDRPGTERGWHFLTGNAESVQELTRAVGFRYRRDPKTGQFAHASGITILTPEGKIARYLFGIDYPTTDLRLALVEASAHKIGSPVDRVLLLCFHYDPTTGRYGLAIMSLLRLAGAATVLALGGFVFTMLRRERRKRSSAGNDSAAALTLASDGWQEYPGAP